MAKKVFSKKKLFGGNRWKKKELMERLTKCYCLFKAGSWILQMWIWRRAEEKSTGQRRYFMKRAEENNRETNNIWNNTKEKKKSYCLGHWRVQCFCSKEYKGTIKKEGESKLLIALKRRKSWRISCFRYNITDYDDDTCSKSQITYIS